VIKRYLISIKDNKPKEKNSLSSCC